MKATPITLLESGPRHGLSIDYIQGKCLSIQVRNLAGQTRPLPALGKFIEDAVVSADGQWVAALNTEGGVILWPIGNVFEQTQPCTTARVTNITVKHSDGRPSLMAFSPDSQYLHVCVPEGAGTRLLTFNVTTSNCVQTVSFPSVSEHVCSPDGKRVAVDHGLKTGVNIYYLSDFRHIRCVAPSRSLGEHKEHAVRQMVFSPNGQVLAVLYLHHLLLSEVETGKEIDLIPLRSETQVFIGFSEDGKTLTVSREKPLLWTLA